MSTTRTRVAPRASVTPLAPMELPRLRVADRLALRVGLALIVWGRRHARLDEHAVQSRRVAAAAAAARATDERLRLQAGPTWWR